MVILAISLLPLWSIDENVKAGGPMIYEPLRGYVRAGHQVHIIFPSNSGYQRCEDGIQLYPFKIPLGLSATKNRNIKVFGRFSNYILTYLFLCLFCFASIYHGIKLGYKVKPHVIYALLHGSVFPSYIVSKLLGARLITRLYGNDLYYYKNTLSVSGLRKIREIRHIIPYILPADYIIMTNDGTYNDILARNLGVPEHKIIYWLNGVYKSKHNRSPDEIKAIKSIFSIGEDSKVIISISRLDPSKRLDWLITALPEVFMAEPKSICLIIGDGSETETLKNLCVSLQIQDKVIFTGALSNQRARECLEIADIFVSCQKQSNLGNNLLEAMVSGKCIVTLDVGSIRTVIAPEQNGVLIKETDRYRISQVLISLLNDDEYRNTLAKNAKDFAECKLLTWEERVDKEVHLIEELVAGRGSKNI